MRDDSVELVLKDEAATLTLGRILAQCLPPKGDIPPVLLRAPLGSGKTTLVRGFVSGLPGAEHAEVSSPSFNLANIYPTTPRVVHVDLYRLGEGVSAVNLEELLEAGFGGEAGTIVVEWAEYLPVEALPPERITICLGVSPTGRTAEMAARGPRAEAWLEKTVNVYSQGFAS